MKPAEAFLSAAWHASLGLRFATRQHATYLANNAHVGPLRVQKALYPEGPETCHCIILHPPAGIADGDSLQIHIHAQSGSKALLTTPGAGKWYRAGSDDGGGASQRVCIQVESGAFVEWLPQENIVFDGARASMVTAVELDEGAGFIGLDTVCLGRRESGEQFKRGSLRLATDLRLAGRALWHERGLIAGGCQLMQSSIGLAGFSLCSTLLAAGPTIDDDTLAACRSVEPGERDAQGGFTRMPSLLIGRYLGHSAQAARDWFLAAFERLRPAMSARQSHAPRIWNT
ncbi:MAG: urease accessory protein UreD [Quisquiliibacterium sp.]